MTQRAARVWAAWLALSLSACASAPLAPPGVPEAAVPEVVALPQPSGAAPRHVLLISVAGLTPAAYGPDGGMTQLAALARAGAAADGVSPVVPPVPAVVHATLVTGRLPAAHGVSGDHPLGPRGVEPQLQREAALLAVPALWDAARRAGLLTAAIGWPSSVGAPVDWLLPELQPARLGETWPDLLEGVATPALLERVREKGGAAPGTAFPGPARDRLLTELACEVLAGEGAPRLLLLRWSQTAPQLARHGPGTPEVAQAFAQADGELRRLAACLARTGRLERSAWFLVGDAPVRPVHTRIQPNVALEAAGLIVPAPGTSTGIARWEALARANGASAFVYARDADSAVLARRALREAAAWSEAFRVVSAEEMLALGADRTAWFGLEARPGYAFGDGLAGGDLLRPSPVRGAAGGLTPARGAMHETGFVAWGAGVRPGLRVPHMSQLDVAPTVAQALGLFLPDPDGQARLDVLRTPPVAGSGGSDDGLAGETDDGR